MAAIKSLIGDSDTSTDLNLAAKRKADAEVSKSKAKGAALDLIAKQESVLDGYYKELDDLDNLSNDPRVISKRARLERRIEALEDELNHGASTDSTAAV